MRAALAILAVPATLGAAASPRGEVPELDAGDGWSGDDHLAAPGTVAQTSGLIVAPDWQPICAMTCDVPGDGAPARSLMVAPDTRGSIRGMQRADIGFGTRAKAGDAVGTVKDGGRLVLRLPIDRAFAMLEHH
jgi:hypothetical protein